MRNTLSILIITCLVALVQGTSVSAQVPTMMNYQGSLTDNLGNPIPDADYNMEFRIYDNLGVELWMWADSVETVAGGFTVMLGSPAGGPPLTDDIFDDAERFLGIKINNDPELVPRTRLVTTPYAFRTSTVDGATGGDVYGDVTIHSTLQIGDIAGDIGIIKATDGSSATITLDGPSGDVTASGKATFGTGHTNTGDRAFVAGQNCQATGSWTTVSGGGFNVASASSATVSGGGGNTASGGGSVVGGGNSNEASGSGATVAGGSWSQAAGFAAVVGGGINNRASGICSVVGGGGNSLESDSNSAQGDWSTVSGGRANRTIGAYATVPGGRGNEATGNYSYASGRRAKALHHGAFVWGDQTDADFSSTATNQFIIRASGGVGIGTNNPTAVLHISGTPGVDGIRLPDGTLLTSAIPGGNDDDWKLGTAGNDVLFTFGPWGVARDGNTLFGANDNTHVNFGVNCETGTSGENYFSATVSGGVDNIAANAYSTVSGGMLNRAFGGFSTIGGGSDNTTTALAQTATIAGGVNNRGTGTYTAIGGGLGNIADSTGSTISGGEENHTRHHYATIGGGQANWANGQVSTIGGGFANLADGDTATIGGGIWNSASGTSSTVGGGSQNRARGSYSVVGGGGGSLMTDSNSALGDWSVIGGGRANRVDGDYATLSGGRDNLADGDYSTVSGGFDNLADSSYGTVGGGEDNRASGWWATVGGGNTDTASSRYSTVAGGIGNRAGDGTAVGIGATVGGGAYGTASGAYSTVPGGAYCAATNQFSFASGYRAKAMHAGSFVWSDVSVVADFNSTANNQFSLRSAGGVRIFSNSTLTAGVTLASGASAWSVVSDSTLKRNRRRVDVDDILYKLSRLPISQWSYKAQDASIEHIGPMAQDFYATFGLGEDNKHISTIDPSGVALAAIQGLYAKVSKLEKENAELFRLRTQVKDLESRQAALTTLVETLLAEQNKSTDDTNFVAVDR